MFRCLSCALFLAWLPLRAWAIGSAYVFQDWQLEDGLPQNSVTAVLQTRDEYLWIGTQNGLVRFDGARFNVFSHSNTPELKSNRITCLCEDAAGVLWIGTEGGGLLAYTRGKFERVGERILSTSSIVSIIDGPDRQLLCSTSRGDIFRLMPQGIVMAEAASPITQQLLEAIAEGKAIQITGLNLADPIQQLGLFVRGARVAGGRRGWTVTYAAHIARVMENQISEIFRIPQPFDNGRINAVLEDSAGNVWIATHGQGLIRWGDDGIRRITSERGLSSDFILCFSEDVEGDLWIGTQGGGLCRLKPSRIAAITSRDGLPRAPVTAVWQDRLQRMWVGTDCAGLHVVDSNRVNTFTAKQGLDNDCITSGAEAGDGTVWVGTRSMGLFRFLDRRFTKVEVPELMEGQIRSVYHCSNDVLCIGTSGRGLIVLSNEQMTAYTTANGLPHDDVRCVLRDRAGALWIGTGGGGLAHLVGGRIASLTMNDGLPSNFIRVLYEDAEGSIWIGTGTGLARIKRNQIRSFRKEHGLPDEVISQIWEDDRGLFWFGSNRGIFRVLKSEFDDVLEGRAASLDCTTYDETDGMPSVECSGGYQPAGWKSSDGKLWFPTIRGLAVVDPAKMKVDRHRPAVRIEKVLVNGREQRVLDRYTATHSALLEVNYTGISLAAPQKVRFRYRLDGLESRWVDAGQERIARFRLVHPGDYRFHVVAVNGDGLANETGASFAMTILPPIWSTWWFRTGLTIAIGLALAALIYGVSVQRLNRRVQALERQNALARERERIAQDMHDQLGASLTQIALLSELASRDSSRQVDVRTYTGKIFSVTQQVSQVLDEIVWTVNPKNDSVSRFVAYIMDYAQEFFENTGCECRFDIPSNLPDNPLDAQVRHQLFLALKEAFTNVLKHAKGTEVWVRIHPTSRELVIEVEDNGLGFEMNDPAKVDQSGLENMRSRVESAGGTMTMTSQRGRGTRVSFRTSLS